MDDQKTTPILPPLEQPIIPSDSPKLSRVSKGPNKFIIGASALLLLFILPITVFYFSQKQGVTEQRSKASGGDNVCTAWSGPIEITGLPGAGEYQSQSDIYIENGATLLQAIWRGDQGWTRKVPVVNGVPNFSAASAFSGPIEITGLPGSGSYQAQTDRYDKNGTELVQSIWRGNQGWTRKIPVVNGVPNFSAASAFSGPIEITGLPGAGDYQSQSDIYIENGATLLQAIWRGDQGWTRKVPVVNGVPNFSAATAFNGPIAITGLPGQGSYQAQSDIYINNGATLLQAIWRGNQGWTRRVPVVAGVPVFTGCPAGTVTPPSSITVTPVETTTTAPPTTVSCSDWAGPIHITNLPGSGDYQAQTDRYDLNGTELVQSIWRGNQGWTRKVPVVNGTPNFSAASAFSGPIAITGLPGTGDYQAQSDIYIENGATLLQAIWRGDQGWTRKVPVVNGVPNFSAASAFSGPIEITGLPGSGSYQAQTDRYDKNGTELVQSIWRGNQGWTRKIPVVNGVPNFSAASAFSGPIKLIGFPGTGDYQSQSDIYIENGAILLQSIWRNNQGWTRRVPVINGVPNFSGCKAAPPSEPPTVTPIPPTISPKPGSCTDANCVTQFGSFYSCVTNVCKSSLKTLPEDINGDGKVNALDYQILLNNYLKSPIPNIMADVNNDGSVNALDYSRVLDKYGAGQ